MTTKKPTKGTTESEFKILDQKTQILLRPNMWIGSTSCETDELFIKGKFEQVDYVGGLLKCTNEVIDNSVDEFIRSGGKFATKIYVDVNPNSATVLDNGRGIPQDEVVDTTGRKMPRPEAAWTLVNAGSNYGEGRTTIGANGVGSSLANYFSNLFIGETGDGKNTLTITCKENCESVGLFNKKSTWQGTKVTFFPDFTRFDCSNFTEDAIAVLEERLQSLAICYPEIEFKFNGNKLDNKFSKYAKLYSEHHIQIEQQGFSLIYTTTDQGFRHNSFVNGVHTKVGGSHVNLVFEKIADAIIPMVKRKYKLEVNRARIKECSTIILFMRGFADPKYDSQTKERLTNTAGEVNQHIGNLDYQKIAKKIVGTDELIMPIIEAALARKLAAEAAAATKAEKKAKKTRVAKHIKANGIDDPTIKTTLFLTEGDSAIGYLVKVRDKATQGGFPLRGKGMNTWNKTPEQIRKNKELFEIMAILNLHIGKPADMTYDYVAIMTDADVDGTGSIYPLLLAFFYKHWPELFEQQRILFAKTPQIISTKGNETIWSYDQEEFETKTFSGNWEHRYIKGLGSLSEDEYEKVLIEPTFDVVDVGENANELFEMLYGKDSQLRKDWLLS